MAKVASTLFDTGPRDDLVAVDVYKDKGKSSTAERTTESAIDGRQATRLLAEAARDRKFDSEHFDKAAKAGWFGADNKDLANRLNEVSDDPGGVLSDFSQEEKDELIAALALASQVNPESAKVLVAGSEKVLDLKKVKSAQNLTRYLTEITGDEKLAKVLDLSAEAVVLDHFLKASIDLGLDEAVDILREKTRDKSIFNEILGGNLLHMAINSDLEGIRKAVGYIGRHEVLVRQPRLIQYILMFYKFPRQLKQGDHPAELTRLLNTLTAVNPQWDMYRREEEWVKTLDPFSYASDEALTLFRANATYRTLAMVAPSYPSAPLVALLRQSYPHIAL